jgi:hypothetical protein
MKNDSIPHAAFKDGDSVVLTDGLYQGARGVFLTLRADQNWASIQEANGIIREHPVAWLAPAIPTFRLPGAIAGHQS